MEDKILNIIYELLENKNLYNYDNDNSFLDYEIIKRDNSIDIRIKDTYYTIRCNATFKGNTESE